MGISRIKTLNKIKNGPIFLALFIVTAILSARLLPHAPNFSPLASIILFGAAYQPKKWWLVWPLLALFVSDMMIGFYAWPIMLSVYGSLLLTGILGWWLKNKISWLNVINISLLSALLFFLVTNGAVWYFGNWYSHDWTGLGLCYTLAIPFFKNTLLSNILYSALLFGAYEASMYYYKSHKKLLAIKVK